ncbi:hypothetical protein [Helicobacter sp. 23-1045]
MSEILLLDSANRASICRMVVSLRSQILRIERSEVSHFRFCDSAILSPNFNSKSLIFSQKGLHPPTPLPPTRQKAAAFSLLGGRASLNPLLAKNRRVALLHPLLPIFCTTKRARLRVLRTNLFNVKGVRGER